ncbi:histidinol-phosphatase [Melioribacter sp. Ez-97]|uniref:histidinol-phosphatase n=1 Tax=Melioribacter sp. Ez-97 TaxID=3423434 RepID=UPI003EDB344B
MKEFSFLKKFVRLLADETGAIIKQYYKTDIKIESKEDETPVTIADKKCEEKMRELIMKEFPDHGILGEEFGELNPGAEYKWILDPIDGTKSFICGVPLFGTLIALLKNGEPVMGAINHPVLNEFIIGDNVGAECNGKPVKIKLNGNLSEAVLLTTDHNNVARYRDSSGFDKLTKMVKLYRTWGDCYGYSLLAQGYADIMIDPMMSKWDLAALIPVIRGAGGKISDFYGNDPMKGDSIVASNNLLHPKIIEILNPSKN